MTSKAIKPYMITLRYPEKDVSRVFTSDDPCKLWDPSQKGTLELKCLGETVFKVRHSDILVIHDLLNEVVRSSQFQKDHASVMVGTDGKPLD
jgi:hypothetical protein